MTLLSSCAPASQDAGGCNARIGFQGAVYRPHNELNQSAPPGRSLGEGDVLGCAEGTEGREQVFAVEGVDPAVAILIKTEGHGVYVVEGLPPSAWPELLKHR